MVRFSRREGLFLMLGASQAALLGTASAALTYDDLVDLFDIPPNPSVVSYWKFQNDGSDEKGTQNARITGSPDLNVETIVDLDTITEGAPVDGKCIAWPGTAGVYAQAEHDVAYKTPQGTVVVTFQYDSLQQKSILVAADRSAGGTSSGPGGLSLEVQTDGSPRCFLRRQSDGAPVILVGRAGDVQLSKAYTLIFKWGPAGLSMALWNEDGIVVRRETDALADGVTGASPIRFGAWHTDIAHHHGPYGRVIWLSRRISDGEEQVLARARTVERADMPPAGVGIPIPPFEYQTISDAVPGSNFAWWDPTNGSDSDNGSTEALAKQSFSAALAAISLGGTIILAEGKHIVGQLDVNKACTIRSKPNAVCVLYREGTFKGALERTWIWTQIDATRKIWESPAVGISDSATTVTKSGDVANPNNALDGLLVIPDGGAGKHFMRLPSVDGQAILNQGTTGEMGNGSSSYPGTHYAGPCLYMPGNGRIRVRMQKPFPSYATSDWPSDGRMGTLINASGQWQEPVTENPNDYEIHIVRWSNFGGSKILFNITASNVTIKGINGALMGRLANIDGAQNVRFEKGTFYPVEQAFMFSGNTTGFRCVRCRVASGDPRHIRWRDFKVQNRYWFQHHRTGFLSETGTTGSATLADTLIEHCTLFGMFDVCLPNITSTGPIVLDHCAVLNTLDDGVQVRSTGPEFRVQYCYWRGGPMGGWQENIAGTSATHTHHNVYDGRIPMGWGNGVYPHTRMPEHSVGSTGPVRPFRTYYNTLILSPDARDRRGMGIVSDDGRNLSSGAHEVYNKIIAIIDNKRYPSRNLSGSDYIVKCYSTQQSTAGTQRFDYNCYHRSIPGTLESLAFRDFQTSRGQKRESFTSLAAFKASAKFMQSAGMYTDGTTGHEQHGVEENPLFRDLSARDYRPRSTNTITGAKNLTSTGWPGTGTFENWKGALDPNGSGNEVGPQDP